MALSHNWLGCLKATHTYNCAGLICIFFLIYFFCCTASLQSLAMPHGSHIYAFGCWANTTASNSTHTIEVEMKPSEYWQQLLCASSRSIRRLWMFIRACTHLLFTHLSGHSSTSFIINHHHSWSFIFIHYLHLHSTSPRLFKGHYCSSIAIVSSWRHVLGPHSSAGGGPIWSNKGSGCLTCLKRFV